jgi:predicted nucleic acid-binding protein
LLAILNASEALHEKAKSAWIELGRLRYRVVLTDWIVAETGNGLARVPGKHRRSDEFRQLRQSSNVEFITVGDELLDASLEFYCRYQDKSWEIVDCCSYIVMHERGITDTFTRDVHFEQAGFN